MKSVNAIYDLKHFCHTDDEEADHLKADEIICTFLTSLGYVDLVTAFNEVKKYYS